MYDDHEQDPTDQTNPAEATDEQPKPARKRAPRKKVPSTEASAQGIEASVDPAANVESEPKKPARRRAPRKTAAEPGTAASASPLATDLKRAEPAEAAIPD